MLAFNEKNWRNAFCSKGALSSSFTHARMRSQYGLGTLVYSNIVIVQPLLEFAINDENDQKNEHGDDRNRYHPICSHPAPKSVPHLNGPVSVKRDDIPTRHPPQRLHAAIHIPLALQHGRPCMLNRLPLYLQIGQRAPPNLIRLVRDPLAVPQPLAAPVQSVRPAQ